MANFATSWEIQLKDQFSNQMKKIEGKSVKAAKKTQGAWAKAGTGISKSFNKMAVSFGALIGVGAVVNVMKNATKSFLDFEQGMAEVATLTDMSTKQVITNFGGIVEATQTTFGKNQQDVIKALYDGFSAGVPVTKLAAKEYLDAVGKMAIAGVTDMKTAGGNSHKVNAVGLIIQPLGYRHPLNL